MKRAMVWAVPTLALGAAVAGAQPAPRPAASPAPLASPARAGVEATVETSAGSFTIRLLPELAPRHVEHFIRTAKSGGYDGTAFHRIVPGGIVQGGDPLSKDPAKVALYGTGGLGLLKAEVSQRPFVRGVVAAARRPSSMDSGGSQFFICLTDQPALLAQYTIFGEVTQGLEVVDRIGQTPVQGDRPKSRVEIRRVTLRSLDPPA